MKTVYIVDIRSSNNRGKCTGHFIPVARNYAEMLSAVAEVKVAAGPSYGTAFEEDRMLRLPYSIPADDRFWIRLKSKVKSLMNCYRLFRSVRPNSCIIWQHSTLLTSCIGILLFSWLNPQRIYMIMYSADALHSRLNAFLFKLAGKRISGILCPNHTVGKATGLPYYVVPDYVYVEDARKMPTVPFEEKTYDFCFVGRFNRDKGVAEALRTLRHQPYRVLVAGNPDSEAYGEELKEIAKDCPHIELHLGYLDEQQYDEYISAGRYSILNYQSEYAVRSSGVVYDSLFRGTPVIGTDCPSLHMVKEYGLGYLYPAPEAMDWSMVRDQNLHAQYLAAIGKYRDCHKEYISLIRALVTEP